MRIKIENIKTPWYAPREEINGEFLQNLAKSMDTTGQWDAVLVRRNEVGEYELIGGLQRLNAAKKLGWKEVEVNVIDVSEQDAALLALETNIMRQNLKEIEEGRAIKKMMDKFELTQKQIAERLGKSQSWVSERLSVALDVIKEVQDAIITGRISVGQAVIISQLSKNRQAEFLNLVIQRQRGLERKLSADETRLELRRFLNDTIYTIGYEGWGLDDFIKTLKNNKIEVLVDLRESEASMYKPEFSKKVLKPRVIQEKIKYLDRPEFGIPFEIREAHIGGGLSHECFKQWYVWNVNKKEIKEQTRLEKLANELKDLGKSVVMCTERYPKPKGEQTHYCHRDILADLMVEMGVFEKRIDF